MPDSFQYDVFLSHNEQDKAVVRPLPERLRADGVKVEKFPQADPTRPHLDPVVADCSRPLRQRTASRPGSQRVRTLGRVADPDTVWLSTRCDRGPVAVRRHDEKMRPPPRSPRR